MKNKLDYFCILPAWLTLLAVAMRNFQTIGLAFVGRISATSIHGNQSQALLHTAGTNYMRVELTATNGPNPVDIVDRQTGALRLFFPQNRGFAHYQPAVENPALPPGFPPFSGGALRVPGSQPQPSAAPARPNDLPPGIWAAAIPQWWSPVRRAPWGVLELMPPLLKARGRWIAGSTPGRGDQVSDSTLARRTSKMRPLTKAASRWRQFKG